MKAHLRRSDIDPRLYYVYVISPNGNPTREMAHNGEHELRWFLQGSGVPADEIAKLLNTAPGAECWFQVKDA
jgi:hypothetical protein